MPNFGLVSPLVHFWQPTQHPVDVAMIKPTPVWLIMLCVVDNVHPVTMHDSKELEPSLVEKDNNY